MSYRGKHRKGDDQFLLMEPISRVTDPIDHTDEPLPLCPRCNGPVVYYMACATYYRDGTWQYCEGCDTAVQYVCAEQLHDDPNYECDWYYVHGLDEGNVWSAVNEAARPPWIPVGQRYVDDYGYVWTVPGVAGYA